MALSYTEYLINIQAYLLSVELRCLGLIPALHTFLNQIVPSEELSQVLISSETHQLKLLFIPGVH